MGVPTGPAQMGTTWTTVWSRGQASAGGDVHRPGPFRGLAKMRWTNANPKSPCVGVSSRYLLTLATTPVEHIETGVFRVKYVTTMYGR